MEWENGKSKTFEPNSVKDRILQLITVVLYKFLRNDVPLFLAFFNLPTYPSHFVLFGKRYLFNDVPPTYPMTKKLSCMANYLKFSIPILHTFLPIKFGIIQLLLFLNSHSVEPTKIGHNLRKKWRKFLRICWYFLRIFWNFNFSLVLKRTDVPSWPTYLPTMSLFRPKLPYLPTQKWDVINEHSQMI